MNKPESKNGLSQQGKARKEAMLGQLQEKLVSVHHKRRRRTTMVKGVAFAAIVVVAGVAWSFLVPASDSQNRIAETKTNTSSPRVASLRMSVDSVGNVDGIDDRCVVENSDVSAELETMADGELLSMLAAVGRPSVLGEIDGEIRIISDAAPVRKKVDAL